MLRGSDRGLPADCWRFALRLALIARVSGKVTLDSTRLGSVGPRCPHAALVSGSIARSRHATGVLARIDRPHRSGSSSIGVARIARLSCLCRASALAIGSVTTLRQCPRHGRVPSAADDLHALGAALRICRLALGDLAHLADRERLVVIARDGLDSRLRIHFPSGRCATCDDPAIERSGADSAAIVTPRDRASGETPRCWSYLDATDDFASCQLVLGDLDA